jgi:lia operon protein LiaF
VSRSNSTQVFFALGLILIGALLLAGSIGIVVFNWSMVWPLVLILFGIWLVWRAFQPARCCGDTMYGIGHHQPDLAGQEIRNTSFSHGFGEFDLELTRAVIPDGKNSVRASHGFGVLTVSLPRDLAVRVKASAGFGAVAVFGRKHEGIDPHIDFQSDDYVTATRKLDLEAGVGFGEVKVVRAG